MTDIYEVLPIADRIRGNRYVGRGIVIGKSANGKYPIKTTENVLPWIIR